MTYTHPMAALCDEILADCDLDYVSLGQVVFAAEEALGVEDRKQVRSAVLQVLEVLLRGGLVEAGVPEGTELGMTTSRSDETPEAWLARVPRPAPGAWAFAPWPGSPSEVIGRIALAWPVEDPSPDLDEVCWFRATPAGRQKVAELRG